jgi:hypothetical protein
MTTSPFEPLLQKPQLRIMPNNDIDMEKANQRQKKIISVEGMEKQRQRFLTLNNVVCAVKLRLRSECRKTQTSRQHSTW